jgi:hypothetical protein
MKLLEFEDFDHLKSNELQDSKYKYLKMQRCEIAKFEKTIKSKMHF